MKTLTWIILTILLVTALVAAQFGGSSGGGNGTATQISITAAATLGTPPNSGVRYCKDCQQTNPCASGGTGAFAFRVGSAWNCDGTGSGSGVTTTGTPANGNLAQFSGANTITNGNLSGDLTTTNSLVTTLVNIPDLVTQAGSILITDIAAPSSPAAGKLKVFGDSTDLRFHDKNAAGTIGTTVVADTGAASNYISAISAAGVITKSRPTCSTLSDSGTGCSAAAGITQLTGDVTAGAGSGSQVATIAANAVTLAKLATQATNTVLGNATSGTAVPTALAVGTCSTAGSALQWLTNTGFQCNTSITAAAAPVSGLTGAGTGVLTFLATPSSANFLSAITDETGSGLVVGATAPTFTTSITDPLVIGGTGAGSSAEIRSTSGSGTTDFIKFAVHTNGGTEAGRFTTSGGLNVGATGDIAAGTINANTAYQVGGTTVLNTNTLGSGILTSSLTTIGTIGTGVWQGTIVNSTYGGTGINNAGRTLTLNTNSGTFAFSGASKTVTFGNTLTFNGTDSTTMTFPSTSATIARTDAANTFTGVQTMTSPNISGTSTTITNVGTFALRDTSAAFDLTIAGTSSTALTAGRTLTIDMVNVAHTLKLGSTANTITFPNAASFNVLTDAAAVTVAQGGTGLATLTSNAIYKGNGTGNIAVSSMTDDGTTLSSTDKAINFGTAAALSNNASYQLIQIGGNGVIQADNALGASKALIISQNEMTNSSVVNQYISTDAASRIVLTGGAINFSTAPSGTAGNTATMTNQLVIGNTGTVTWSTNLTNAAGTPGSLCYNTSTFEMTKNNALTCTVSSRDFKQGVIDLNQSAFDKLRPVEFAYRDHADRPRWGFIAEEAAEADRRFADGYDKDGIARSLDQNGILAATVQEVQRLKARVAELEAKVKP